MTSRVLAGFVLLVVFGGFRSELTAQSPVDQPAVVNDSLALDDSVLDSAEVWTDEPDDQGNRHLVVVSYHVSRDSLGPPTLERLVVDRARPASGGAENFIDRWRSALRLGSDPQIQESFQRTALAAGAVGASFTLSVAGGHFQLSSPTRQNGGPVPVGVLTPRLLGAAIAALPESLPDQATIWILDLNTGLANPQSVSFGAFEVAWLPVAQGQDLCGQSSNPVPAPTRVRWASAVFGNRQVRFPVLASRPHLRVDAATLRCLRLPSRSRTPS